MWLSKDSQAFPSVLFSSYSLMESKTLFIGKYSIFHISVNQFCNTHFYDSNKKSLMKARQTKQKLVFLLIK